MIIKLYDPVNNQNPKHSCKLPPTYDFSYGSVIGCSVCKKRWKKKLGEYSSYWARYHNPFFHTFGTTHTGPK